MMPGQASKRLHKAAAAGGRSVAVLSRPSSRKVVAAGRARGSYQAELRRFPHSLALWQLASALKKRGAYRFYYKSLKEVPWHVPLKDPPRVGLLLL